MKSLLWRGFAVSVLLIGTLQAQTLRGEYLQVMRTAADRGWADNQKIVDEWKRATRPSDLWGYDAPWHPICLADLLGYLYQETKDRSYAEKTRDLLAGYGDLRAVLPADYPSKRIEYRNGVPALSNFFIMPPYARAYMRIRESGVIDRATREKIERDLAYSLDHTFHFPEWGAHNRAMLRAESLYYGALALPGHPNAPRWRQLAETLAADSMMQWEIEDASGYQAVWLYSVFSYADIAGREDVLRSPIIRYYLDYFVQLLTPHGNIADFGDTHWNAGWERFVPVFEKAATIYRNPAYKFVAQELLRRAVARQSSAGAKTDIGSYYLGVVVASCFTDAHRWADDGVKAERPTGGSREVLEDVIGKKFVFRNGWDPRSTMMLLNYRDEGDGGLLGRDYLRQTISVEEEKMHHGHADENSISLLMSGGSVLLHDGGYRPGLPSGPFGAWRADYFHNRVVARKNKRDQTQKLDEFLRNSGAYRRVRTQKVDFLNCREADVGRSRLTDDELGYTWDRTIVYLRESDLFVVVDGVKVLRGDYFTFSNLWHSRRVTPRGDRTFVTSIDRITSDQLPDNRVLTIHFPENAPGKQIGTFATTRHNQDETTIYQTVSGFYNAGDMEYFVTVLIPHDRDAQPTIPTEAFRLVEVDRPGRALGVEFNRGSSRFLLGVKLDLAIDLDRQPVGPRYQYNLGRVTYGDFETDASFLLARLDPGQIAYSAATMTRILHRGRPIMQALPTTFGLQLDGAPPRPGYPKWRFWEEVVKD